MSRLFIQDWIDSLRRRSTSEHDTEHDTEPGPKPTAKRRRVDETQNSNRIDLSYPYDAPYTPSPTMSDIDHKLIRRGAKRGGGSFDENPDVFSAIEPDPSTATPKPPSLSLRGLKEPSSKRRSRSTSPIKGRLDLQRLEKPVRIDVIEDDEIESLPADIRTMYSEINQVVAHGIGAAISPSPAVRTRLQRIRRQAMTSIQRQRHECGWNSRVHAPLLELAFESDSDSDDDSDVDSGWTRSFRVEAAMSASISRESIPRLGRLYSGGDLGASSVSGTSVSEDSITGQSISQSDTSTTRPNNDNRKVDYVVVVDVIKQAHLRETILELILSAWDGSPAHVNQTTYPAISESLIATSIETKTVSSSRDPLLQLAIWVAAWHQRMYQLRSKRIQQVTSCQEDLKLVSVPLISVTNHDWDLYLACDEGDSIWIRGPLRIGSTATDLQLHALFGSLKIVRKWIRRTFYRSMCDWFVCKADRDSELVR
ncbi:hypothetical protein F5Y19DRAFT_174772 [Xylariaceae sp. FL1651]|nr:hypothetical protein F5Y19DRAFT_174772 [Xylariaceae sp. FL1651]